MCDKGSDNIIMTPTSQVSIYLIYDKTTVVEWTWINGHGKMDLDFFNMAWNTPRKKNPSPPHFEMDLEKRTWKNGLGF